MSSSCRLDRSEGVKRDRTIRRAAGYKQLKRFVGKLGRVALTMVLTVSLCPGMNAVAADDSDNGQLGPGSSAEIAMDHANHDGGYVQGVSSDSASFGQENRVISFEDDVLTARVIAPVGVLPEDAVLEVEEIAPETYEKAEAYGEALSNLSETLFAQDKVYTTAKVYDIRILNADGNEIEPSGQTQVTIEYKRAQNMGVANEPADVAHLASSGDFTIVDADFATNSEGQVKGAQFSADSFSYFIVFTSNGSAAGASEEVEVDDSNRWLKFYTPADGSYDTNADDDPANTTVTYSKWGLAPVTESGLNSIVDPNQSDTSKKHEGNRHYRRILQVVLHDSETGEVINPGQTQYFWTWENTVRIDDFNLPGYSVVKTRMETAWDMDHDWSEPAASNPNDTQYADVEVDGLIGTYRVRGYRGSNGEDGQINKLHVFVKNEQPQDNKMRYIVRYVHADGSVTDGSVHYLGPGDEPASFNAADYVRSDVEEYSGMSVITGIDALYDGSSIDFDEANGTGAFHYNSDVDLAKVYVYYKSLPDGTGANAHGRYDYENGKYYTGKEAGESGVYTNKYAQELDVEKRQFLVNLETWNVKEPASVGMVLDASGSMAWTAGKPQEMKLTVSELNAKIREYNDEHPGNTINEYESGYLTAEQLNLVMHTDMTDNTSLGYNGFHYYVFDNRNTINEYVALGYSPVNDTSNSTGKAISLSLGDVYTKRYNGPGWYFVNSQHTNLDVTGKSYEGLNGSGGPAQFYIENGVLKCRFWDGESVNNTNIIKYSSVYEKRDQMFTKNETLQDAVAQFGSILNAVSPSSEVGMTRFSTQEKTLGNEQHLIQGWTSNSSTMVSALDQGKGATFQTTRGKYQTYDQYEYSLTAQTRTYKGLDAFVTYLKPHTDDPSCKNSKYVVIFTDGRDTNNDGTNTTVQTETYNGQTLTYQHGASGKRVAELKADGYTIITVLMKSLAMDIPIQSAPNNGKSDYEIAAPFLQYLASGGKDGDASKKLYFEADSDDAHEMVNQFRNVAEYITTGLQGYSVRDYIDPRFDVINDAGTVLSVLDSNGEFKHETNNDVDANGLRSFTTYDGKQAMLGYDSQKQMFYVVWQNQNIPSTDLGSQEVVNIWKGQIRIQAKQDFLGGNDILTNGNEANMNSVYKPKTKTEPDGQGGTRTVVDVDQYGREVIDTNYVYEGFPYASVNPGLLDVKLGNYEDTVFLGESITPGELLSTVMESETSKASDRAATNKVADTVYDASKMSDLGDTDGSSKWFVEYLERLGQQRHGDRDFYYKMLRQVSLTGTTGVQALINNLKTESGYTVNDAVEGRVQIEGPAGEKITIQKNESIQLDVPYYYLESPTDDSTYAGRDEVTGDVDPCDDKVGMLTYKWELKEFADNTPAPDAKPEANKFVTFDTYASQESHMSLTTPVKYQFSIAYDPVDIGDAEDGNDEGSARTRALTGLTSGSPKIRDAVGDPVSAVNGNQNTTSEMGWAVVHAVSGRVQFEKRILADEYALAKEANISGTMTFALTDGTESFSSQAVEFPGTPVEQVTEGGKTYQVIYRGWFPQDLPQGDWTLSETLSDTLGGLQVKSITASDDVEFRTDASSDPAAPYDSTVTNWKAPYSGGVTFKIGQSSGGIPSSTSYSNSSFEYSEVTNDVKQIDPLLNQPNGKAYLNSQIGKGIVLNELKKADFTVEKWLEEADGTQTKASDPVTFALYNAKKESAEPGAAYVVPYQKDGNAIATQATSASTSRTKFENLLTGVYILEEGGGAPMGYSAGGPWVITVANGGIQSFEGESAVPHATDAGVWKIVNKKVQASLRISKLGTQVGSSETVPLEGAQFELRADNAGQPGSSSITWYSDSGLTTPGTTLTTAMGSGANSSKAIAVAYGLQPNSTFWIVETEAPEGYELADPVKAVIDSSGRMTLLRKDQATGEYPNTPNADSSDWMELPDDAIFECTITDSVLYALPAASGMGILEFLFLGAFLMTLIAGIAYLQRRYPVSPRAAAQVTHARR